MIALSLVEFASRRRTAQARIEEALRLEVERALDGSINTDGYADLMTEIREQWSLAYGEEMGQSKPLPERLRAMFIKALRKTDQANSTEATVDRITTWLATAILSSSTVEAAQDDPEEILLEWVDMGDNRVRETHAEASGQTRPLGEDFRVGEVEMPYPGYPGVEVSEWINCRCTVRQVLASEALVAAVDATEVPDDLQREGDGASEVGEPTHAGLAVWAHDTERILMMQRSLDPTDAPEVQGTWEFPGGGLEEGEDAQTGAFREFTEETGLPIPEGEVINGWRSEDGVYQGFVYAVDFESQAWDLLNPEETDVVNPDDPERSKPEVCAWFTREQIQNLGPALRPEVAKMDWTVFDRPEDNQEDLMPEDETTTTTEAAAAPPFPAEPEADECLERDEDGNCIDPPAEKPEGNKPFATEGGERVPWHSVLAPEGVWSGDRRRFREGSLSNRPLPLPITWQKISAGGHDGNVVVAVCDRIAVVDGEQRASGWMLNTPEADEVMGLLAEFGRFGISVDADSAQFEMNEEEEGMDFTAARTSSACLVSIPAFAEAWFALGQAPEGFLPDEADTLDEGKDLEDEVASLVASFVSMADLAPGKTEDGPGWLTHPVDTDRLRDYWTQGEGAAKIAWGTPGDFRRCRVAVAEYIKPQYLNGYCANRHYDAIGVWPGQEASNQGTSTETPGISLVASVKALKFDHGWFKDPEFAVGDGRMVQDENGNWACPATVLDDGQVFGHVAGWKTCHGNWAEDGICVTAPHSATGYAHFLTGQIPTDIGDIPVGALTVGGGHAPDGLRARAAAAHYDATSSVWAYVNVGEDQFGIWFSGVLKPGLSQEKLVEAMAAPLSGDWRLRGANLEMIAAHSVVTPGFSIPRIAAGIDQGQQISLVAAGVLPPRTQAPQMTAADLDAYVKAAVEQGFAEARVRREKVREAFESLQAFEQIQAAASEIEGVI